MNKYLIFLATIVVTSLSFNSSPAIASQLQKKPNTNFAYAQEYIAKRGQQPTEVLIVVDTAKQTLELFSDAKLKTKYTISTSSRGLGQIIGTYKTPLGLHQISEKIGENKPHYSIFKSRQFTGNIWPKNTPRYKHKKDFIVTRILRLEGLEQGLNRGEDKGINIDTKSRAVYIHGTTMEWLLGKPTTKGCVHMSSEDVVHLFKQVPVGTLVLIKA